MLQESTSFPMSIQLTEAAVQDAGTPDTFCSLGARPIKGKGIMSTYLMKVQPTIRNSVVDDHVLA